MLVLTIDLITVSDIWSTTIQDRLVYHNIYLHVNRNVCYFLCMDQIHAYVYAYVCVFMYWFMQMYIHENACESNCIYMYMYVLKLMYVIVKLCVC
jgi:hypothetical protein